MYVCIFQENSQEYQICFDRRFAKKQASIQKPYCITSVLYFKYRENIGRENSISNIID